MRAQLLSFSLLIFVFVFVLFCLSNSIQPYRAQVRLSKSVSCPIITVVIVSFFVRSSFFVPPPFLLFCFLLFYLANRERRISLLLLHPPSFFFFLEARQIWFPLFFFFWERESERVSSHGGFWQSGICDIFERKGSKQNKTMGISNHMRITRQTNKEEERPIPNFDLSTAENWSREGRSCGGRVSVSGSPSPVLNILNPKSGFGFGARTSRHLVKQSIDYIRERKWCLPVLYCLVFLHTFFLLLRRLHLLISSLFFFLFSFYSGWKEGGEASKQEKGLIGLHLTHASTWPCLSSPQSIGITVMNTVIWRRVNVERLK